MLSGVGKSMPEQIQGEKAHGDAKSDMNVGVRYSRWGGVWHEIDLAEAPNHDYTLVKERCIVGNKKTITYLTTEATGNYFISLSDYDLISRKMRKSY
jgi:hypothetical protein